MVKNAPCNAGSRKIPHALEQLSPQAAINEPMCLESMLQNKRSHCNRSLCTTAREKPLHSKEDPIVKNTNKLKKKMTADFSTELKNCGTRSLKDKKKNK